MLLHQGLSTHIEKHVGSYNSWVEADGHSRGDQMNWFQLYALAESR